MLRQKFIILSILLSGFIMKVNATHLMGGSLTYEYLSYNTSTLKYKYKVTLKLYRDCNGTTLYPDLELGAYIQDNANPNAPKNLYNNSSYTIPLVSSSFIPLPGQSAGCNFASNVCVEEGIYQMDIDLSFSAGGYHLIIESCCRNNAIVNLNNPGGQGQSYYAFIPPNYIINSSPTFVDAPVPYICAGDTASLLNSVTDPDGDVLTYSFVKPYQGQSLGGTLPNPYTFPVPTVTYNSGYSETQPFGAGGFISINAANGLTQYESPNQGFYVVAVEIKEYRNNQLIGKTRRDMQIVVVNCPANASPVMTADPDSGYVITNYNVAAGNNLCFTVSSSDPSGDSLYLTHTGNIFNSAFTSPPATMSNASGVGFVSSQFCWNTSCSQAGTYVFFIKSTDNGCPAKTINQVYTINVSTFGPSAINGPTSVCANQSGTVYSVSAATGVNYNWSVSGGTITSGSGTNSITVKWGTGTSGTISITETNTSNCTSNPVTLTVNIKPPPNVNAGADKSICNGSAVQIGNASVAGVSYSWTPATGLSNASAADPTTNVGATTTYFLNATGANGCTKTDTVIVTVNPLPNITSSPLSPSVCAGGSVNINANGANTYTWSPSTGLDTTAGAVVISTPPANITYTITGTNTSTGCANSGTVTVTINPNPTVNLSPRNSTICAGNSATLTASGANNYTWSPAAGLNTTTGTTVIATPSANASYIVTGTNTATGCTDTAVANIIINPLPVITVNPTSTAICAGSSTNLTASGANTYSWSPSIGLNTTTGATVTANPTATTTYTVTGTHTATGCTGTTTVTVTVNPLPNLTANPNNPAICAGTSVSITTGGANTYTWSPATGLNTTAGATVIAGPASTTTYTITGTNTTTGCVNTLNTTVTIKPLPVISVTPSSATICTGSSANLTASGANTYIWTPSTGLNTTNGASVSASPIVTTTYTVTGTNTTTGCLNDTTVTVSVNPLPVVTITPPFDTICAGQSVTLNANGANTYTWSPASGLNINTGATVIATPNSSIIYIVTGTNTTTGCIDTQSVRITVNPLPNINITPATASICYGDTALLIATGANSYLWSPSIGLNTSGNNSVYAFPAVSTLYTATGTDVNGCVSSDTVRVNIKPLPFVNAGNDTTMCFGANHIIGMAGITGNTYSWFPSSGLSNASAASTTASPDSSTQYILTVTNSSSGCKNTDTVIVNINALPLPNTGNDTWVCPGSSITLNAYNGINYLWAPGATLNDSTIASPSATPSDTTTYVVIVTDANGCVNSDTITVDVNPTVPVNAGTDRDICFGTSTIIGSAPTAPPGTTFNWQPALGLNDTTLANPIASPLTETTYIVYAANDTCRGRDTITIKVNALPAANAGNDVSICYGASTILTGSGGSIYNWQPPTGLNDTSIANPTANPLGSINYILTVTDTNGCVNKDTVNVNVNTLPNAFAGIDATICNKDSVQLGTTNSPAYSYSWQSNPAGFNSTAGDPIVNPAITTSYYLTATDTLTSCLRLDTIIVTVNPLPDAKVINDTALCMGNTISLGDSAVSGNIYSWTSLPAGFISSSSNPLVNPSGTTTYYLTETILSTGCKNSDSVSISVNPLPVVNAGNDTALCLGASIQIGMNSLANNAYNWSSNPTGYNSIQANPIITPAASAIYTLLQTNLLTGCYASDSVSIIVNPLPVAFAGNDTVLCYGSSVTIGQDTTSGHFYSWTSQPSGFSSGISNPTVSPIISTTYYLTETIGNTGCFSNDSVTVMINPLPATNPGNDSALCIGSSMNIGTSNSAGTTYSWTSSPAGFTSANGIVNISPTITTTYYLTETINATNCSSNDSVLIIVNPLPLAITGNDTVICIGGNVSFGTSPITGHIYNWSSNPIGVTGNGASIGDEPIISTTYYLTETNTNTGCSNSDTAVVIVNPIPNAPVANSNSPVCVGDTIRLFASSTGTQYNWTGVNSFTSTLQNPTIGNVTNVNGGIYLVTVTVNGCVSPADSVNIIISQPSVTNAGPDQLICKGTASVPLNGSITGGSNTGIWSTSGNGSFSPDDTTLTNIYNLGMADSIGVISVILTSTNNNNCKAASDTMLIVIGTIPNVSAGPDLLICSNAPSISLIGNISGGDGSGNWTTIDGTGTFAGTPNMLNNVYHASPQDIANGSVLFVLHSTNACTQKHDTVRAYFEEPPVAEFSSNTAPYNINEVINFENASTGAISWQWDFGNNTNSSGFNTTHSYSNNGIYPVMLIATDEHNCTDTVIHDVEILVVPLALPTAFTPNGDGANDILFVKGGPFASLEFRVYNEWGNMIFISNSQQDGWDGTYKGQEQPSGVYTYTVNATDAAGRQYKVSGDITLIR